jgi:hypothetical protein
MDREQSSRSKIRSSPTQSFVSIPYHTYLRIVWSLVTDGKFLSVCREHYFKFDADRRQIITVSVFEPHR